MFNHSVKWPEAAKTFGMVNHVREMTAKKSCKHGEYGTSNCCSCLVFLTSWHKCCMVFRMCQKHAVDHKLVYILAHESARLHPSPLLAHTHTQVCAHRHTRMCTHIHTHTHRGSYTHVSTPTQTSLYSLTFT